ncbi:AAA family ATPase [Chloroflexota bacterium]
MDNQIHGFEYKAPLLDTIYEACMNPKDKEGRILLIVGPPGCGKSVFLSQLFELLGKKLEFLTAVKAELSDANDAKEIISLFEDAHTVTKPKVLLLDSLDILASGRMEELHHWLTCLNKLRAIPFATAVCACRSFEADHLYPLNITEWSKKYSLDLPDHGWIRSVIESTEYPLKKITPDLLNSLTIPLHLKLAVEVFNRNRELSETETLQTLYTKLLEVNGVGPTEFALLTQLANKMVEYRSIQVPLAAISVPNPLLINNAVTSGLMVIQDNNVRFFHQTLIDFILAWEIISSGKSLYDFLIEKKQSLFVRPIIRHVLSLLRNTPRRLFDELGQIFFEKTPDEKIGFHKETEQIRAHVKLAILSNIASWPNPTRQEVSFLLRIFQGEEGRSLVVQFFTRTPHNTWFPILKDTFLLPSLEHQDSNRSISLRFIESVAKYFPTEVLDIGLELAKEKPSLELGSFFHGLVEQLKDVELDTAVSQKYADLIEMIISRGFVDWYLEIQVLCLQLSKIDPERSLDLFFTSVQRELHEQPKGVTTSGRLAQSFGDFLPQIFHKIPLVTLLKSADFLETVFYRAKPTTGEGQLLDFPTDLLYGEHADRFGLYSFYEWFRKISLEFSRDHPEEATRLIEKLANSRWYTQNQLAFLCMSEIPERYIGGIAEHIYTILGRKLDELSPEHEPELLLRLVERAFRELPKVDQQRIMAIIISLDFKDDLFTRIWIWRPLHHIPEDLQTPPVKARIGKLDSQFGLYSYHPPIKTTGVHTVVSPVPQSELKKLEPEALYQFLISNRDLKGSWKLEGNSFLGGAEELASEAAKVLIEDLEKYRPIVEKLANHPENDIYLERFLGGLWEKEIESVHLEWLSVLISRTWKRENLQLEIARLLRKMVDGSSRKQFDNLKPILIRLSTSAVCPESDRFFEYRTQGFSNDALGEGINSTRGAMCEAILRFLVKFEDAELIPILEQLAEDKTISVRASLIYYLPLGLKPLGWNVCFGLFNKASQKGLAEYTEVAGRFLQYIPDSEIPSIEPLLDNWLETKTAELERMVMSLAAIYYLRNMLSYDKINSWFTDGKIQRESKEEALGILANHVQHPEFVEKVISIFNSLLDNDEQTVSKSINNLFLRARPDDFHELRPIIEEVAKRPAIRGPALYDILNYLEKCLLVNAPSCFEILEMILNTAGDDFYNFRDFIPAAHSKVPLAILNTILECYLELEERALKVLDKLIELRWSGVDEYLKAAERL